MKKAFIILGNGFTIDFLHYYAEFNPTISDKIDVRNLFRLGDKIDTPWDDKPGFLSYKHCPSLWTLGARPGNTIQESTALIEGEIWREKLKKVENLEMSTVGRGIWQEN